MEVTNEELFTQEQVEVKKPGKGKAILFSILGILLFLGIQVIASMVGGAIAGPRILAQCDGDMTLYMEKYMEYVQSPEFLTPVTVYSQIAIVIAVSIWYYFGFVKKTSKEEKAAINKNVFTGKTLITALLAGIGFYTFDVLIASAMAAISPELLEQFSGMMSSAFDFSSPLTFVAIVILAPLGEELVFRGVVLNSMRKAFPMWAAIIVSAVLFAVAHGNLFQIVYVLPLALALGYIGFRYKSVLPGILIHLVNNFAAIGAGKVLPESFTSNDVLVNVVYAIVAIVAIGLLVFVQKDNLKKN